MLRVTSDRIYQNRLKLIVQSHSQRLKQMMMSVAAVSRVWAVWGHKQSNQRPKFLCECWPNYTKTVEHHSSSSREPRRLCVTAREALSITKRFGAKVVVVDVVVPKWMRPVDGACLFQHQIWNIVCSVFSGVSSTSMKSACLVWCARWLVALCIICSVRYCERRPRTQEQDSIKSKTDCNVFVKHFPNIQL